MQNTNPDTILIIDFGSQYTQLIARRVREKNVFSVVKPNDVNIKDIKNINPKGIILSGGPESVSNKRKLQVSKSIFNLDVPILGICYGMQLIADYFNGTVISSTKKEFGHTNFVYNKTSSLFNHINLKKKLNVWMSHSDNIAKLPKNFTCIGSSTNTKISAFAYENKKIYGLQFHPEVTHTECGNIIISNFIHHICKCKKSWTTRNIINESIQNIKNSVQNNKVLLALSGGVDSTVVAALLKRAIGKQLTCVFINTGLLRKNEVNEVKFNITKKLKIKLTIVNAENIFFKKLRNITDPEKKRKIIGETFIRVFESESKKYKDIKYLGQGTIYPDVIESSSDSKKSDVIKSHHNVGGLPKKINFKLIEPIRNLFKDEVRKIGKTLSVPEELLSRHPFPGPGLAVRIIGEVTKDKVAILQDVDSIFIEEIKNQGYYNQISQALAVFLPIKSVGVMGDQRKYNYVVAIRAVNTIDFMTANACELPYKLLKQISTRIVNEVPNVSRVVYDITSKPPGTIEWE
ncbi:MAG: glutamine-hydrolyzing GMP synthase [Gammaproteobacteria bacterium]|nr:glutamine-hydrolyzing GMP synthase [Gammaproteobacteria bacterium]|tara:strand:+ start:162346 stop:163899 length:1554 start_codon:yes stop_codon:yes gene_type:complete